jgi:hypothetical protein
MEGCSLCSAVMWSGGFFAVLTRKRQTILIEVLLV